jgi:hypothetical protein
VTVQRAGKLAVSFPVAEVIEDLTFDEATDRPSQLETLGVSNGLALGVGGERVGCGHSSTSGIET